MISIRKISFLAVCVFLIASGICVVIYEDKSEANHFLLLAIVNLILINEFN